MAIITQPEQLMPHFPKQPGLALPELCLVRWSPGQTGGQQWRCSRARPRDRSVALALGGPSWWVTLDTWLEAQMSSEEGSAARGSPAVQIHQSLAKDPKFTHHSLAPP